MPNPSPQAGRGQVVDRWHAGMIKFSADWVSLVTMHRMCVAAFCGSFSLWLRNDVGIRCLCSRSAEAQPQVTSCEHVCAACFYVCLLCSVSRALTEYWHCTRKVSLPACLGVACGWHSIVRAASQSCVLASSWGGRLHTCFCFSPICAGIYNFDRLPLTCHALKGCCR